MKPVRWWLVLVIGGAIALVLAIATSTLWATAMPGAVSFRAPAAPGPSTLSVGTIGLPSVTNGTFAVDIDITYSEADTTKGLGGYEADLDHKSGLMQWKSRTVETIWNTGTPREVIDLPSSGQVLTTTAGMTTTSSFGAATCGQPGCSDPNTTPPSPVPPPNPGPSNLSNAILTTLTFQGLTRGTTMLHLTNAQVVNIDADIATVAATDKRLGVYPSTLLAGKLAFVGIPVALEQTNPGPIDKASEFAAYLGGSAQVEQILKWDTAQNPPRFQTYFVDFGFDDFNILTGDGVFVFMKPGATLSSLLLAGAAPESGSLSFNLRPGTVSGCQLNVVTVPWYRPDLIGPDKADDLANAISSSGGVEQVLAWDTSQNPPRFTTYFVDFGFDNFAVEEGGAYFVCIRQGGPTAWTP